MTGVLNMLRTPAGRGPRRQDVELSRWFNDLSAADQAMVAKAVAAAAEQATYNVLLVIDGMLPIESTREKGRLQLVYVGSGDATLLNDEEAEPLTSLFREAAT